jgi:hypothetical protein
MFAGDLSNACAVVTGIADPAVHDLGGFSRPSMSSRS